MRGRARSSRRGFNRRKRRSRSRSYGWKRWNKCSTRNSMEARTERLAAKSEIRIAKRERSPKTECRGATIGLLEFVILSSLLVALRFFKRPAQQKHRVSAAQKPRTGRRNCGQRAFAASRLRSPIPQPTADAVGYLLPLLRSYLPPFSKTDLVPPPLAQLQSVVVFPEDSRQNNAHFFERLLARE